MKILQIGLIFAFLLVLFISNSIQTVSSAALLKKTGKKTACQIRNQKCGDGNGKCCEALLTCDNGICKKKKL